MNRNPPTIAPEPAPAPLGNLARCQVFSLNCPTLFGPDPNHGDIALYLRECFRLLQDAQGQPRSIHGTEAIGDLPLRALVGFTSGPSVPQRLVLEACWRLIFGRKPGYALPPDFWRVQPYGWQPLNERRENCKLDESWLDVPWMLRLGVPRRVWECNVFGYDNWDRKKKNLGDRLIRLRIPQMYLTLAAYGFSDPDQFFTYTDWTHSQD
jgi:hypothetical protein